MPRGPAAFSLIELLTVMAVIAVLAALTFGSGAQALRDRASRQRATAELAVLATALEAFRRHHGSYPQTDRPDELYAALTGHRNARNAALPARGRAFLAPAGLTLATGDSDDSTNRVLDPWGQPYGYAFSVSDTWRAPGYLLYSCGPDGDAGAHVHGLPVGSVAANADNLYPGR